MKINANFKVTESDSLNQKPNVWIRIETVGTRSCVLDILITAELQH